MRKLSRDKGFTLVEMLACVVTLLLIGLISSAALNMATKSYWISRFESDSQMLESTLDMYIGDILRYSNQVETDAAGNVTAISNVTYCVNGGGIELIPRNGEEGGRFLIRQTPGEDGTLLVGEAAYAGNLYIEAFVLVYDENTGIFTGEYTIRSSLLEEEARKCVFSYKRIANL